MQKSPPLQKKSVLQTMQTTTSKPKIKYFDMYIY